MRRKGESRESAAMDKLRRRVWKTAICTVALFLADSIPGWLPAQAKKCYLPGESVDPGTFFLDAAQNRVKLSEAIKPGTKVVALVIFGGAYLNTTDKHRGIWCEDSLDEFANLKAASNASKEKGVQFIAVACPPVYSDKYGFERNVFLDQPDDSPKYRRAVQDFIERTETLRKDRTIPFEVVYYDPRFRLLWNTKEYVAKEAYGPVYPWQGKLKWHNDDQRYGTPCLWFLDSKGQVLREPLYGNNYSAVPPKILFTYWELQSGIADLLAR
jgi:hypothetical protein